MYLKVGYKFKSILLEANSLQDFKVATRIMEILKNFYQPPKLTSTYWKKVNADITT